MMILLKLIFLLMQETISLLDVIDKKLKRQANYPLKLRTASHKQSISQKTKEMYPYAKVMDFSQSKYNTYPKWLIQKQGFVDFMYNNYEAKLMSIPKICNKNRRSSDQKYFLGMFLDKISELKNLPTSVREMMLTLMQVKQFKKGECVHEDGVPSFMAVVYVGSVEYTGPKGVVTCEKNDVLMKQAFRSKNHPRVTSTDSTVLLTLSQKAYNNIIRQLKKDIQAKSSNDLPQLFGSSFFSVTYLRQKRAKQFYSQMNLMFFFHNEIIEEVGQQADTFYILMKGAVQQHSHIYVRDHNKWPLPDHRWEVRAVYNSFNKQRTLQPFSFFGDQQLLENGRMRAKYIATNWALILSIPAKVFMQELASQQTKRLKKYRVQNMSTNFSQLQTKVRKKAHSVQQSKKIIVKALNSTYADKDHLLSSRKKNLLASLEKSMLKQASFFSEQLPRISEQQK